MRSRPSCGPCFSSLVAIALVVCVAGCQPAPREDRAGADAALFGPADIRLHPFTAVKDFDGDAKSDGVEALIELQDRFRDPTKSTGTVIFELYDFQQARPDARGQRLAYWRAPLLTLEEQRARWNRISRTYSFQLEYPGISTNKSYVLQAWFEHSGKRLTSQVVLERQDPDKGDAGTNGGATATTKPTTRPTTTTAPAPYQPGTRTPAP
ncbi:MAG TPA: hypothetical protein VEA69_18720 [Tepidisphaeraceae bacterium]|nr:hypothetical protein [Tepidisphaeraceae bacterium]